MHFFLIYAIVLVVGLSGYLFRSKYLSFADFKESYQFVNEWFRESSKVPIPKINSDNLVENTNSEVSNFNLTKSLRHLEFVNRLESYAKTSKDCPLTINCLKELENSKLNAQKVVLNSALELSALYNLQAA